MKNSALLQSTSRAELEIMSSALAACQSALTSFNQAPAEPARGYELQQQREALAQAVAGVPRKWVELSVLQPVLEFQRKLALSGACDGVLSASELDQAVEYTRHGTAGLIAAMLLAPAWQLSSAPTLDDVPVWLWGNYASWLFFSPAATPETTGKFPAHWLKHLQVLDRWVQRNPSSTTVQAALEAYLQAPLQPELFPRAGDLRRQAELRGHILARALVKDRLVFDPGLMPRDGRRLRIAFLARHFGPGADLYATFPCLEHLDPKHFEIFLLALENSDTPEAKTAARRAKLCHVLPTDEAKRIAEIRSGQFDILVFGGDVGATTGDLTRLAVHRLATLQVVNHRKGLTTGLPEIDLAVASAQPATADAGAGFTERLGLLRGPSHTFAFLRPEDEALSFLTREQIGMPETITALAAVVTPAGVSSATIAAWAEILARTPGTGLYVAVVQDKATGFVENFCARIDAALARQGVDPSRVTVLPSWGGAALDIRNLFACSDLYLDATDAGTPLWLAEALVAGLPAVAFRCPHNPDLDAATGLLADAHLTELIGANRENYIQLAVELAGDRARRADYRARLKPAVASEPAFLDTLAASDAFGALLMTAYDELVSLGREEFRQQREPLRCFGVEAASESVESGMAAHARGDIDSAAFESALALRTEPANYLVRYLHGLVLHAQGDHSRAVDYLVGAVQNAQATPAMWFALAQALRANRQTSQAIQALEVCIRLDPKHVDALLLLLDLAEGAGATDMARDVLQLLQAAAPDDARVLAMS